MIFVLLNFILNLIFNVCFEFSGYMLICANFSIFNVIVSCIGFSLVLRLSFFAFIRFTLWIVLMEFIGFGLFIATILW